MKIISDKRNVTGGALFWTLKPTSLRHLRASLSSLKLERYCPETRATGSAMKAALDKLGTGQNRLVRPLEENNSFGVFEEIRGVHANNYPLLMSAKRRDDETFETVGIGELEFRDSYESFLHVADASMGGRIMTKIVTVALDGVPLRESGGLYWVPGFHLPTLRNISDAFAAAKIGDGESKVYLMETGADSGSVEAVRDSMMAEVTSYTDEWMTKLSSGELGLSAIETIRRNAEYTETKLRAYEKILSTSMQASHELLQRASVAINSASMAAAAKQLNMMASV